MRRLGQHLGVEAMSLYKHVAGQGRGPRRHRRPGRGRVRPARSRRGLAHGPPRHVASRRTGSCVDTPGPDRSSSRPWSRVRRAWPTSTRSSASFAEPGSRCPTSRMPSERSTATCTGSRCRSPAGRSTPRTCRMSRRRWSRPCQLTSYPNLFAMGSMVATSGQGIPVDFTFGLDLLLDGLERRLAEQAVTG